MKSRRTSANCTEETAIVNPYTLPLRHFLSDYDVSPQLALGSLLLPSTQLCSRI